MQKEKDITYIFPSDLEDGENVIDALIRTYHSSYKNLLESFDNDELVKDLEIKMDKLIRLSKLDLGNHKLINLLNDSNFFNDPNEYFLFVDDYASVLLTAANMAVNVEEDEASDEFYDAYQAYVASKEIDVKMYLAADEFMSYYEEFEDDADWESCYC